MPKKIIFVDFDGTLCEEKILSSVHKPGNFFYPKRAQIESFFIGEYKQYAMDWMYGKHDSEMMCSYIGKTCGIDPALLFQQMVKDAQRMHIPVPLLEKLRLLRERYFLVLATGNMDCLSRFTVPALKLDTIFHQILNSFYERCDKSDPSGRFYAPALSKCGGRFEDSLLIDNSEVNCGVFGRLGGEGILTSSLTHTGEILDRL